MNNNIGIVSQQKRLELHIPINHQPELSFTMKNNNFQKGQLHNFIIYTVSINGYNRKQLNPQLRLKNEASNFQI